jgi:hypothetical protein
MYSAWISGKMPPPFVGRCRFCTPIRKVRASTVTARHAAPAADLALEKWP